MDTVESKLDIMACKYLDMEARSKRQNVIMHGVDEQADENCVDVFRKFVNDALGYKEDVGIQRAHRVGKITIRASGDRKPRPLLATLDNATQIDNIFVSAKEKLSGTTFRASRDYPQDIRNARRELGTQLMQYRRDGHSAYIAFPAKLIVNGQVVADKFPKWQQAVRPGQKPPLLNGNVTVPSTSTSGIATTSSSVAQVTTSHIAGNTTTTPRITQINHATQPWNMSGGHSQALVYQPTAPANVMNPSGNHASLGVAPGGFAPQEYVTIFNNVPVMNVPTNVTQPPPVTSNG